MAMLGLSPVLSDSIILSLYSLSHVYNIQLCVRHPAITVASVKLVVGSAASLHSRV